MATEDTVHLSEPHAPHQASIDAFSSILEEVKAELVKLRHDHDSKTSSFYFPQKIPLKPSYPINHSSKKKNITTYSQITSSFKKHNNLTSHTTHRTRTRILHQSPPPLRHPTNFLLRLGPRNRPRRHIRLRHPSLWQSQAARTGRRIHPHTHLRGGKRRHRRK